MEVITRTDDGDSRTAMCFNTIELDAKMVKMVKFLLCVFFFKTIM